jgi:oligopeptide/dipeptide ABC transporter ATP-binding protein
LNLALRMDSVSVAIGGTRILEALDLEVARGEFVALVGESGSGKTIAALSVTRQLPAGAEFWGRIVVDGTDVLGLDAAGLRRVRGGAVGMVFQNPLSALNPSHTVGAQIAEAVRLHARLSPAAAGRRALELMREVGIRDAENRTHEHPHRFSGGQRQRVMIAIALAAEPKLLIADEPTTGLDPLVAQQILSLLARLRRQHDMGVLFVTHDFGVVRAHADRVHVLYAGRTVETGPRGSLLAHPRHPYTSALLAAVPVAGRRVLLDIPGQMPEPGRRPTGCRFAPRCDRRDDACEVDYPRLVAVDETRAACLFPIETPFAPAEQEGPSMAAVVRAHGEPLLTLERVAVRYGRRAELPPVLRDVSLSLGRGECLGIVGESGSGKSTLGRAILQMVAHEGRVLLEGRDLGSLSGREALMARRRIQVVFQDPRESLNPSMSIGEIVTEPLRIAGVGRLERRRAAGGLLEHVGLPAGLVGRAPRSISGGQAQRVAIARALAAKPDLIVLDEPTSSLDVSTQATLLNLLKALGLSDGIAYLLISHDLAAVSFMADRIAVLRSGEIVELQETRALLGAPRDAYTAELVAAAL